MRILSLVTLAVVLSACSSRDETSITTTTTNAASNTSTTSSTSGGGGAGGDSSGGGAGGGGAAPSGHCIEAPVAGTVDPSGAIRVTTEHYALYAETDKAVAEDYARLLEASYGEYVDFFEQAPALGPNERLDVRFYASPEHWAAALVADGFMVPKEAGGVFEPSSKRAYLYEQHNPYYNQALLLHEAAHQFHLLGRAQGKNLPFWYVEGIAEHLGRHDWDGHCVNLGAVPLMNWDDMPQKALEESGMTGLDVASIVSGQGQPSRAASWAVVHYLEAGAPAAQREGFHGFRKAFDESGDGSTFASLVGAPNALGTTLAAWLPNAQQAMTPVYLEWVHRSSTSVLAYSEGVFSLAVVKGQAKHFEATYDVPEAATWNVGVVLGYDDPKNFLGLVVSNAGKLSTFTDTNGSAFWGDAGTAPATTDGKHGTLAVDFLDGGKAKVTVNGVVSEHAIGFSPRAGLSINDTRVTFRELAWN